MMKLVKMVLRLLPRWRLWLVVKLFGFFRIPLATRRLLGAYERDFKCWVKSEFPGCTWRTTTLQYGVIQPFQDLLNRPAGGDAYCGGLIFSDPQVQPELRHFRGFRAIDRPLVSLAADQSSPLFLKHRQFWCGPLAFHFGHQIADFGSRVLLASIDTRDGELLWCPWRTASSWDELLPWQRFLLTYLNPGGKHHRITTAPIQAREIIVVPQQARMRAAPTVAHLEALSWCERILRPRSLGVVYVSRSRFASCRDATTLIGGFAGEELFEQMLRERGVTIVYPETLGLEEQLEIYSGSSTLIVAEGSAQHGLELLGFHKNKNIVIICRRPQQNGMERPLMARFPRAYFLHAIQSHWQAQDGVPWNGLAMLDWDSVASVINPLLERELSSYDCRQLHSASDNQLKLLSQSVRLKSI